MKATQTLRRLLWAALILAVATPVQLLAQSSTERFAAALDDARENDRMLLVHFYSSDLGHQEALLGAVKADARNVIHSRFTLLNLDLAKEDGLRVAEGFFDINTLSPADQNRRILGIVHHDGRRGVSILEQAPGAIEAASWATFAAPAGLH